MSTYVSNMYSFNFTETPWSRECYYLQKDSPESSREITLSKAMWLMGEAGIWTQVVCLQLNS